MGEKGQVTICFSLSESRTCGAAFMKPNNEWCWLVRRQHSTLTKKHYMKHMAPLGFPWSGNLHKILKATNLHEFQGILPFLPKSNFKALNTKWPIIFGNFWNLLKTTFWRCVLQPTSLERFSAALESCWFLWNGWCLWEICIIFPTIKRKHHYKSEW